MTLIPVSEKETIPVVKKYKFAIIGEEDVVKAKRAIKYVPVIPTGNGCCSGICKNINAEIEKLDKDLEKRRKELSITTAGQIKTKIRRQKYSLTNRLDVLEDFRIIMKEDKICECINYTDK